MKKTVDTIFDASERFTLADVLAECKSLGIKDFKNVVFDINFDYGYYDDGDTYVGTIDNATILVQHISKK